MDLKAYFTPIKPNSTKPTQRSTSSSAVASRPSSSSSTNNSNRSSAKRPADSTTTTTSSRKKPPKTRTFIPAPFVDATFQWPGNDYRPPGSGDYDFDSIRGPSRERSWANPEETARCFTSVIRRVGDSTLHQFATPEEIARLRAIIDDADMLKVVSFLFQRRSSRWTRFDAFSKSYHNRRPDEIVDNDDENDEEDDDDNENKVEGDVTATPEERRRLRKVLADALGAGILEELPSSSSTSPLRKAAINQLLTKSEIASWGGGGATTAAKRPKFSSLPKSELIERLHSNLAIPTLTSIDDEDDARPPPIFRLTEAVHSLLTRLHQLVWCSTMLEPEEIARMMRLGIPLPCSSPAHPPSLAFCSASCWMDLSECFTTMTDLATCAGGEDDESECLSILHRATSALNGPEGVVSSSSSPGSCECWMSRRARSLRLRCVWLGVHLLERARRYEEANHYLRFAMMAVEPRLISPTPHLLHRGKAHPEQVGLTVMYLKLAHRLSVNLNHLNARRESLEEMERVARLPNVIFYPTSPSSSTSTPVVELLEEEEEEEEMVTPQKTAVVLRPTNRVGGPGALVILQLHSLSKPPLRWVVLPGVARGGLKALVRAPERTVRLPRPRSDSGKRVEHAALEFLVRERGNRVASPREESRARGMHAENGLMLTLFALFFIDFEGSDKVKARRPLGNDWPGVLFCCDEETDVARVLENLRQGLGPEMIERAWDVHYPKRTQVRGLNWERNTRAELVDIARCVPGAVFAGVSRLFLEAYEAWNGGLPDLFLWDAPHRWSAFVEIKGPGDSLSERQLAWNEKLVEMGAEVSTLYVEWEGESSSTTSAASGFISPLVPPPTLASFSSSSATTTSSSRTVIDLCP